MNYINLLDRYALIYFESLTELFLRYYFTIQNQFLSAYKQLAHTIAIPFLKTA